ncbi:MAG: hypothetical protein AVDCRST_MAG37-1076 [uncultured Rubrobacteraceae bacterium]|uniref:Uncharacterized protein n=1 Tax=uncultured Rubrobacteraceae bacterium TaxID=349277 RepID=A0A6J4QBY4_9ACTN|nr:MAG: hypothetical protein AVDCRST_MAG37-1076 [uncultured Rubrobacteraceae bacterium]
MSYQGGSYSTGLADVLSAAIIEIGADLEAFDRCHLPTGIVWY